MAGLTVKERDRKWALFEQGLKHCYQCGRTLSLEAFDRCSPKSDGRDSRCKECKKAEKPNAGKRKRKTAERKRLAKDGLKRCSSCNDVKSVSEFYENSNTPDGLCCYCISCSRKKSKRGNTGEREEQKKEQEELQSQGLKKCSTCGKVLPIE